MSRLKSCRSPSFGHIYKGWYWTSEYHNNLEPETIEPKLAEKVRTMPRLQVELQLEVLVPPLCLNLEVVFD